MATTLRRVRALLLSTYELGHQPLHVGVPAAALQRAGHQVRCIDLSVQDVDGADLRWAQAVAISVPMHTAMRLARTVRRQIEAAAPGLPVCFYGLYAAMDDGGLDDVTTIAGEYETDVVAWLESAPAATSVRHHVSLERRRPSLPARDMLPPLERYAHLVVNGERRLAGYVEASHGCAHRCRHCPVPVVYDGRTRIVPVEDVVADVAQLVRLGARHLTFGDPDFLNGPQHARRVVDAVHQAFPDLTFDVTAKVEHILAHRNLWPLLAERGCLFVITAVESASDTVLARLDKGHTVADAVAAVSVLRAAGIEPRPSLLPFTPWTEPSDYMALLDFVAHCDLVGNVDPVHYAIRLLVPPGSLLLDSGDLAGLLGPYDPERLTWTWRATDPRLDQLADEVSALAEASTGVAWDPAGAYRSVRALATDVLGPLVRPAPAPAPDPSLRSPYGVDARPRLTESWFCCAEPTDVQWRDSTRPLTIAPTGES